MSSSRRIAWMIGTWLFILVIYSTVSLSLKPRSEPLSTFGNLVQCLVPLLANAGLLLNAGTPHWRRNVFWMLIAMSCTLWMIGQFQWTYYEVYIHESVPDLNGGDIVFFLRGIPMMAALALRPHLRRGEISCASDIWIWCSCSSGGRIFMPLRFCRGCMLHLPSNNTITTTTCWPTFRTW